MRRCRGKTKTGIRCKKSAQPGSGYCSLHSDQAPCSKNIYKGFGVGAGIGAILGSLPGAIIFGVVGAILGKKTEKEVIDKTKVFISFDYDNDFDLKTLLAGQAKYNASPFEIADWSVKEHLTGDWKAKVRSKLRRVDQMIVICGRRTHTAVGVSDEIKIAQEEGVPYFLLKGRTQKACTKPKAAKRGDKLHMWTWANLKALVGGGS